MLQSKWNHYICPKCKGITVARHDDEGVTPFILRCRAKDTVENGNHVRGCDGFAESQFFMVPQEENQKPHVIFFRPSDPLKAIDEINKEPKLEVRGAMLEHYQKGGSLMKEVWDGGS